MDVETEALTLGWVPKEQFRGDPEKWTDAETFVTRGKEIMPILRKNNERLLGEVDGLKGTVSQLQASLKEASESMEEFRQYHNDTAKRAYEQALRDLRVQKVAAIKEGDAERVVEIDEAVLALNADAPKPLKKTEAAAPPPPAPPVHPDFATWERENQVWLQDQTKQAYAQSIATFVRSQNPNLIGRAFLDKITEAVEEKFAGPAPKSSVEGGRSEPRSAEKSYSKLPPDAQAACDRFAVKLVGPNRAFKSLDDFRKDYASKYQWE
jgi:hypothetical protein